VSVVGCYCSVISRINGVVTYAHPNGRDYAATTASISDDQIMTLICDGDSYVFSFQVSTG